MFRLQCVLATTLLMSMVDCQTQLPNENEQLLVGTYGECGGIKCDRYGVCKIVNGVAKCYCGDGSTGVICQVVTIKQGCTLSCKNFAVCQVDSSGSQRCVCPDGFYGQLCQYQGTPSCSYHKCFNGAVCKVEQGIRYCDCPSSYTGQFCENRNWCEKVICENSGDCVNEADRARCKCLTGFTGPRCELDTKQSG